MKKLLFLFLCTMFSLTSFSQGNVSVRFNHLVGDNQLVLNQEYFQSELSYNFSITRLQYYISEIEITHDGGQKTSIPDTWLLVDVSRGGDFDLGIHQNIGSIEAISYWIGVDPEHNHLDPTSYPEDHPLAPKNPDMHWGWAAGYRFACLEGNTGMNLILGYQIHGLGDNNYAHVSFETGAMNENGHLIIPINADYMGLYKDIDVSNGLIEHGEFGAAATLLENFSTEVYSATYYTAVDENKFDGSFAIGPNPSNNGKSKVMLSLPSGDHYEVKLIDFMGRVIKSETFQQGNHTFEVEPGTDGVYFVSLSQNNSPISIKKLIISH